MEKDKDKEDTARKIYIKKLIKIYKKIKNYVDQHI